MKLIISHIEFLLSEHDCVIVPGFGGFVVQEVSAKVGGNTLFAPSREICFNTDLVHDDGLLLSHIVKIEGIEYTTAKAMLQRDILHFRATLGENSSITFGSIGKFTLHANNSLEFNPTRLATVALHHFGMKPLTLTILSEINKTEQVDTVEQEKTVAIDDTVHIHFSRRKFIRTAASVAAIGILWVFSSPFQLNHQINNSASLVPFSDLARTYHAPVAPVVVDSIAEADTITLEALPQGEIVEEQVSVESAPKAEKVEMQTAAYYIILGSFQSEESAERHQKQLKAEGVSAVKVAKLGSMSRTYLRKFSDQKEAEQYMRTIRYTRDEYNDTWIYCQK